VLRTSLDHSKLEGHEKMEGFRRLHRFVETVEKRMDPTVDLAALLAHEVRISPSLEGRSVADDRRFRGRDSRPIQMNLFDDMS
jgi:hypothetical protein